MFPSTTFNHQIFHNMVMDIDLCWRNSRKITLFFIWISQCESAVFQINQPSDFAVRVVTMHTLLYSGHVRYDKNNDIMSPKVNTAAPWSHRDPVEHILEPGNSELVLMGSYLFYMLHMTNMFNKAKSKHMYVLT